MDDRYDEARVLYQQEEPEQRRPTGRRRLQTALPGTESQGRAITLHDTEPWPEPVDGRELLKAIEEFITGYLVLPNGGPLAGVAWVLTTYTLGAFDAHPYLAVTSPEKECGKTRLLEVLECLVRRSVRTAGMSEAVLYRLIEKASPTLLMDEQQHLRSRDERSATFHDLLCAGNRRGALVLRIGGPNRDRIEGFSVFAAKAIACIGELSDVITSRAIEIRMRRKTPEEAVGRFFLAHAEAQAAPLRQKIMRWANDNLTAVQEAYRAEVPPDFLADREAENWLPLIAVIRVTDPETVPRLLGAAQILSGAKRSGTSTSNGIQLLADTHTIFEALGEDQLPTEALLKALHMLDDSPWRECQRGHPLSAHGLAGLLRQFGVVPGQIWYRGENKRGYQKADFLDVWKRYLPPLSARLLDPAPDAATSDFQPARDGELLAGTKRLHPAPGPHSSDLAAPAPLGDAREEQQGTQDDGRRAVLLRLGKELGFPRLSIGSGESVSTGEATWRTFAQRSDDETIARALAALEHWEAK